MKASEDDALSEEVGLSGDGDRLDRESKEKSGKIIWRVMNGFMTMFFLMAAGVQFNDPDPYLWVPLYGIAALLTVCIAILATVPAQQWWRVLYWVHAGFCLGMFAYVTFELVVAVQNPESDGTLNPLTYEEGRELAGILITSVWLFTCKQSPTIRKTYGSNTHQVISTSALILFSLLPFFLWILCYTNLVDSPYFSLCTDFMTGKHYEDHHAL